MNKLEKKTHRNEHPFWLWESIMAIPQMLNACLQEQVISQINHVAERCSHKGINKVFLVGTGSSYFAAVAERFAFEEIAGLPTLTSVTTEFKGYPPRTLDKSSAVFFHSHSGGTQGDPETVEIAKERGAYTVGITDIENSKLAKCVDDVIIGPGSSKIELPATRTYTTAIFRMLQLAIRLGRDSSNKDKATDYDGQIKRIPDLLEKVSKLYAEEASETVEKIRKCTSFFVIGSGPNIATADESALGISQSGGIPAQAFPVENFLHGPIQTLRDHMGVIAIAAPGPLQERIIQAAEASKVIGAKVIVLAPKNMEGLHDFDVALRLPDGIPELLTPVIYITPLWQIAYHFSLLGRGCHTDRLSMDKPEFKKAFSIIMQKDKKFE